MSYQGLFADQQTEDFHNHYRDPGPPRVRWLGVEALKCPLDLWIYQELIVELRPSLIIEGGTCAGGSALFMATILDCLGIGKVITMDYEEDLNRPKHPRIQQVIGDTLDPVTVAAVHAMAMPFTGPRMLILDDGHSHEHVAKELELYHDLLRQGDILIVEDTDLGGPFWGFETFQKAHPEREWQRMTYAERLKLTFNPAGYYRCAR